MLPAGDSKTGQLRIESGARVCARFAAEYDSFSEYSIWIGASFGMTLSLALPVAGNSTAVHVNLVGHLARTVELPVLIHITNRSKFRSSPNGLLPVPMFRYRAVGMPTKFSTCKFKCKLTTTAVYVQCIITVKYLKVIN